MAKITDPFAAQPPRFTPGATSPLDQTARNFSPRIAVDSWHEQRRAEQLPGAVDSGRAAPTFRDRPTPPPYTTTTPVPVDPAPGPKAGGSKS